MKSFSLQKLWAGRRFFGGFFSLNERLVEKKNSIIIIIMLPVSTALYYIIYSAVVTVIMDITDIISLRPACARTLGPPTSNPLCDKRPGALIINAIGSEFPRDVQHTMYIIQFHAVRRNTCRISSFVPVFFFFFYYYYHFYFFDIYYQFSYL